MHPRPTVYFVLFLLSIAFDATCQIRDVDGTLYDTTKSKKFIEVKGDFVRLVTSNTVVLQPYKIKNVYLPGSGSSAFREGPGASGFRQPPVLAGINKVLEKKIVVKNVGTTNDFQRDQLITCRAMKVGTTNLNGEILVLYDQGSVLTMEMIAERHEELAAVLAGKKFSKPKEK